MTQIISFDDYTPPIRFDAVPWTDAQIEEATASDGTYTIIDTIALSPLDDDPSDPQSRSFTTALASDDPDLWYRVVFLDADLNVSQPTTPIQNTASSSTIPYATVAQLAAKLKVNPTTYETDLLRVLTAAALEIDSEIGGPLAASSTSPELALAATVNLARAQDLWLVEGLPIGVIGLGGETPLLSPRDSWVRHANTLQPLKDQFGFA